MSKRNKRKRPKDSDDPERLRLEEALDAATATVFLPNPKSPGIGKFNISPVHGNSLKGLFYLVIAKVKGSGVTWGEGEYQDPRRRMYGFLPGKRKALINEGIQIQKFGANEDSQEHEDALKLASVDLVFASQWNDGNVLEPPEIPLLILDDVIMAALQAVTDQVHSLVPEHYQKYTTMEQLIAVQPNLHNGASYLPAHLDFPRNDGFGIIIVTVGVRGSGSIVLIDDGDNNEDARSFAFDIAEGEAYMLCGDARNKCIHGVLCHKECFQRETLNLRYGLHSPQFAYEEIDRHWPD